MSMTRDPIERPVTSDRWDTPEGEVTVVGSLMTVKGPFTVFDSARGREVMSPTIWRKFVKKSRLVESAEEVIARLEAKA